MRFITPEELQKTIAEYHRNLRVVQEESLRDEVAKLLLNASSLPVTLEQTTRFTFDSDIPEKIAQELRDLGYDVFFSQNRTMFINISPPPIPQVLPEKEPEEGASDV